MALPTASDNPFPSVLFDEQAAAPTTPPSGFWRAYFKSDGLYVVDDTGTEVGPLVPGAGASNLQSGRVVRTGQGANLTTTTNAWADMDSTNLTLALTTGARRVMLQLTCTLQPSVDLRSVGMGFSVDGTPVLTEAAASNGIWTAHLRSSAFNPVNMIWITDVLAAGAHTFKPRWNNRSNADTITAFQGASQFITFTAVELYA